MAREVALREVRVANERWASSEGVLRSSSSPLRSCRPHGPVLGASSPARNALVADIAHADHDVARLSGGAGYAPVMSDERPRVTVNQVVAAAVAALPNFLAHPPVNMRIEEVIPPAHADDVWRVTLSHLEAKHESADAKALRRVFRGLSLHDEPPTERAYHIIEVDAETGQVGAMRMRERA